MKSKNMLTPLNLLFVGFTSLIAGAQTETPVALTSEQSINFLRPAAELRGSDFQGCGGFYCSRWHGFHDANDYKCTPDQKIVASVSGLVTKVGWSKFGHPNLRYVRVRVSDLLEYDTHYLNDVVVAPGDMVQIGQMIGRCADLSEAYPTAYGMKNHVHQVLRYLAEPIDAENHPAIKIIPHSDAR